MARRLSTFEIEELIERTKHKCDHNCDDCYLWMPREQMCYHELNQKWEAWNIKEHKRFGEILK